MERIIECFEAEIEAYCREVVVRFHLPLEDVLSHANKYWKIKLSTGSSSSSTSLPPKVKQAISPPRPLVSTLNISDPNASIAEIMGSSAGKKKKEDKPNKCTYKYKSGKEAGNPCNAPCSGERCNRHSNTQSTKSKPTTSSDQPSIDTALTTPITAANRKLKKQVGEISEKFKDHINTTLIQDRQELKLVKNNWGRYIHQATRLVYDPQTETIIGKQLDDETDKMTDLNANDIEQCRLWHIKYKLPTTIPSSTEDNVKAMKEKEIEYVDRVDAMVLDDDDDDEIEDGALYENINE
jgi:hypothetical protein